MFLPKKLLHRIGPGVITGASDDDPSGIATYSQTGAQFGFGLLWMAVITTPMMMAVQEMSARLGMVTGRGLAALIRKHVSHRSVIMVSLLLLVANTVNIGADLGAMAAALQLLAPLPVWTYLVVLAAGIALLEVFISYRKYVNLLRWLTLSLLAYVATAFVIRLDWVDVFQQLLAPALSGSHQLVVMIVAVLGTTISPYLFFWQTSEEVEEEISGGRTTVAKRTGATPAELKRMRGDVATGMVASNLIMFFIIVTSAAVLHAAGTTDIQTAAQAASALRPLTSDFAFVLFALGIVGTGLLAIPILAGSASYALAESFGWSEGLSQRLGRARAFYLVILGSIGVGLLSNFVGIPPFSFLILAAVLNGVLAPVMLWYLLRLADDPRVVGVHRSPRSVRVLVWVTWLVMSVAAVVLLVSWLGEFGTSA